MRRFLRRGRQVESYNDLIFIALVLVIAWVPLPFGSNLPLFWTVNAVLFGVLLVLFELGVIINGGHRPVALSRFWPTIALFGSLVAWIVFQLSTLAPATLHSSFWQLAGEVLQQLPDQGPLDGRISADPDGGVMGLVGLSATAIAFYLALQLCRDRQRADLFMLALALIAFVYALYGLVQFLAFPDTLVWIRKTDYRNALTSTFVNRNSYATYAGIGLIMTIGLLTNLVQSNSVAVSRSYRIGVLVEALVRRGLPIFISLLVIGIALMWTGSRAGIICSLAGAIVLVILAGTLGRRRLIVLILGGLAVLTLAAVIIGYGEYFVQRLANDGGSDTRWYVTTRSIEAALDVPWTGFGYGSFDRVFAVYREDMSFMVHWDKAHNTYAELLFELGAPAFTAFLALGGGLLLRIIRNLYGRQIPPMLSLSALGVSALVLLHAFVDFSLQMQAVAVTYWSIMGAGLAQSWSRRIDTGN